MVTIEAGHWGTYSSYHGVIEKEESGISDTLGINSEELAYGTLFSPGDFSGSIAVRSDGEKDIILPVKSGRIEPDQLSHDETLVLQFLEGEAEHFDLRAKATESLDFSRLLLKIVREGVSPVGENVDWEDRALMLDAVVGAKHTCLTRDINMLILHVSPLLWDKPHFLQMVISCIFQAPSTTHLPMLDELDKLADSQPHAKPILNRYRMSLRRSRAFRQA